MPGMLCFVKRMSGSANSRTLVRLFFWSYIANGGEHHLVSSIQVGDGSIAIYRGEDEGCQIIGEADHGEFSSQTVFLTSDLRQKPFAHRVKPPLLLPDLECIALMTDGVSDDFSESERLGELFADAPVQGLKTTEGDEVRGAFPVILGSEHPADSVGGLDELSGQGFVRRPNPSYVFPQTLAFSLSKMKKRAQLSDGRVIEYVHKDKPPAGGMKKVYFTPDKKYALCFYKDPNAGRDSNRIARIQSIIGKYNPTVLRSNGGRPPIRSRPIITASFFVGLSPSLKSPPLEF